MTPPAKALGGALMALLLLGGATALTYARWTGPVRDADRALALGDWNRALAGYRAAEARFDQVPAARQFLAPDYDRVVGNQLWILYRVGRYDEVIDRAERAPEASAPHFWAGLAFFAKARAETKSEAQLGWLSRSEEELRKAVEANPADWDTKYDFELATRLAAELRKQPKTPPNQLMQLLRPQPKPGNKPGRRVG
jgi:tetratricopeptide (TPR) repeat protein